MKPEHRHFAALLGAGLVTTLSSAQVGAQQNPFELTELDRDAANRVAEAAPAAGDLKEQAANAAQKMKGAAEMKCGAQMMMKKDVKLPDPKAAAGAETSMKLDGAKPATAPAATK